MNGVNNNMTIIVVSCDEYADMWDNFFFCKEKYWPDCPYPIVLANNSIMYKREGVETINCGDESQWSNRTRIVLNQIQTKYVCFVLEDFYFSSSINTEHFESAISLMEKDNISYYKLLSLSKIKTPNYRIIPYLREIPDNLPYGISLMAAIWEKDFFLDKIGNGNYNPWKFEVDRIKEEKKANGDRIVGVFDDRNILNICHMAVQGKYLPPAVNTMKRKGFCFDFSKREIMPKYSYWMYCFKGLASQWTDKSPLLQKIVHCIYRGSVTAKIK